MIENRVDGLPSSALAGQSKIVSKILQRFCKDLADEQRPDQYTKKSVTIYLNTFAFETGINPPTQQQINLIYYYLEDDKKLFITKSKFQSFLKKCMGLYIQSKRQCIGGIIDRLVLLLRNQSFQEKQKQMETNFNNSIKSNILQLGLNMKY